MSRDEESDMGLTTETARMASIRQAILTRNFDVGTLFSDDAPIADLIAAVADEPTDNAGEPRPLYEGRKGRSASETGRTVRSLRLAADRVARANYGRRAAGLDARREAVV
jgi:hypothetical protein